MAYDACSRHSRYSPTKASRISGYAALSGYLPWYGLAMLFFTLASAFIQYFLALDNRAFLWIVIACCLTQTGALCLWHATVGDMVWVMVVTMGALLLGLAALYTRLAPAALYAQGESAR